MNLDRFGFKAMDMRFSNVWIIATLKSRNGEAFEVEWNYEGKEKTFSTAWIKPETICQCTGLKDSVGNLIYENDIVRVVDRDYTVVYHEPSMSYEINGETDDRDFSTLVSWVRQGVKCVVIGNKFDKEEDKWLKEKPLPKD